MSEVTESVVMVPRLQVHQGSVSNVLQDKEGQSQQACSNQVTNLESQVRSGHRREEDYDNNRTAVR